MTRLLIVIAMLVAVPAFADDDAKPWAAGVSDTEQAIALQLYDEGNVEFQAARFQAALAKYAEALKHWDHPAIHFNMAVCLINLDQPLEANEHLQKALAYKDAPFGADMYAQGLTYQHSLDGQIARITIACSEPNAKISLDGVYAFTGPGQVDRVVLPGNHQVVATKPGFQTASETLQLFPSKTNRYDVHLIALKPDTIFVRYWSPWKPWSIVGGGVAIGLVGALFMHAASHNFTNYDADVAGECPHGCSADLVKTFGLDDLQHRGNTDQHVAIGLFVAGGAVMATGIVGVILNQPRGLEISPVPGGGATVLVRGTF